ncbi:RHS repeat domain-containing protein [Paenibacillus rhizoplanae]
MGRKTTETNPLGAVTTISYTSFGKEKAVKDPYGSTVENKYDLNGNLVSVKDQAGSITIFNYDAANRLIEKKSPLALDESKNVIYAVESFQYDPAGNMTKKIFSGIKKRILEAGKLLISIMITICSKPSLTTAGQALPLSMTRMVISSNQKS